MPLEIQATVNEGGGFTVLARATGQDGEAITIASTSKIEYQITRVYDNPSPANSWADPATPTIVQGITNVTVATAVYDTLQTDAQWTQDATGYNLRIDVPATALPAEGSLEHPLPLTYNVWFELRITPVSGLVSMDRIKLAVNKTMFGRGAPG